MPGLSVLIPVFNRTVTPLVHALQAQIADWDGPVEIRCLDDGSSEAARRSNRRLTTWPGVYYAEIQSNIGRAAIRNRLAQAALHEWLLFLDNDSVLPDTQFLARYAAHRGQGAVLVGGTMYESTKPDAPELQLRWLYGQQREARPAATRRQAPHSQFTLNNILMRAELFRRFELDEQLTRYGHEDTKFGWLLRQAGIGVQHLDNAVLHDGLESATAFLQKSHDSVLNLTHLYRTEGLGTDTKLLQTALRLERFGLVPVVSLALSQAESLLRRNLLGPYPRVQALDALKLRWALQALRTTKALS